MMSPLLTWVIYLNRLCRWTNYHFSTNNGRPRSSVIWCACSKTWMQCARRPRNGSVMPGRESVPTVTNGLNAICIVMWLRITWTLHSCGGARCPGERCGRARHRIAWIMFGGGGGAHYVPWDIKSASLEQFVPPWTVRPQVWSDWLTPIILGFQLTFSCSATSI